MKSFILILLGVTALSLNTQSLDPKLIELFGKFSLSMEEKNLNNPFSDFFEGFVNGIKLVFQTDLLLPSKCIQVPQNIWDTWVSFAEYIRNLDWKHFSLHIFIKKVIGVVWNTLYSTMPCVILGFMIEKWVMLAIDPSIERVKKSIRTTILVNFELLLMDFKDFFSGLMKGDLRTVGECLAQVIYVIILH